MTGQVCQTETQQRNKGANRSYDSNGLNRHLQKILPKHKRIYTLKAVLRGKFIVLSVYIKNLEKSHTSVLTAHHLKALGKKRSKFTQEEEMSGSNQIEG